MKPLILIMTVAILLVSNLLAAQKNSLPKVNLHTLKGELISTLDVFNGEQATILVFWKTNDRLSQELVEDMITAHHELLADKNVRLIGICINCNGSIAHIRPYVMGQDWNIEMYIDKNGEFKRAMGILETPSTIIYNTGNEVICHYNGYNAGTEGLICEKLSDCLDATPQNESFALVK